MSVEDISCNFLLPIEFCKNKKEVFENLYNDLELLKSNNSSKNSFYSKLFSPITPHGKLLLQKWSKYYTSNVDFLKAEKFLKKAVQLMPDDPVVNDHYGDILWKLGKKIQARYFWISVLDLKETEDEMKKNINIKLIEGLKTS